MSWFGGGLSNLQGKITSFTAQVLNDVAESVQGVDEQEPDEREEAHQRPTDESLLHLQQQNNELTTQNRELESQLSTLSRQFRNLLSLSKGNDVSATAVHHQHDAGSDFNWRTEVGSSPLEFQPQLAGGGVELNGADGQHNYQQELERRIAALEQQLVDLDQQHQADLEVAVKSRDELKEENSRLRAASVRHELLDQLKEENERLKLQLGRPAEEEVEALKAEIVQLHSVIARHDEEHAQLARQVKLVEELSEEIGRLQSVVAQHEEENIQLEKSRPTEEMERLSEEVSRLQSLVAQHEIEKGQQESNRTDLREQNDGLQSIAAGHTSNHAQQQVEELDQLRKEIGLMRSQSAQHSIEELDRLESDHRTLRQQIGQFREQFQALGSKLAGFEELQARNKELEKVQSSLNAELASLASQNQLLTSMTSVLDRVTEENKLLETSLESAHQSLQSKSELVDRLLAQVEAASLKCVEFERMTEENSRLRLELEEAQRCRADTTSELGIEQMAEEKRQLLAQLETLNGQLVEAQSAQRQVEESKSTELGRLVEEINRLNAQLETSREELAARVQEEGAGKLETDALQSQLNEKGQQLAQLEERLSREEERRKNLEAQSMQLREELENAGQLKDDVVQLRSQLSEAEFIRQELDSKTEELSALQLRCRTLTLERDDQGEQVASLGRELLAAREQTGVLESERAQLRQELDRALQLNDELSRSNSSTQAHLAQLQSQLDAMRLDEGDRTASLTRQLESAKEESARLDAEVDRLRDELATTVSKESEKQAELDQLRSQLEETRKVGQELLDSKTEETTDLRDRCRQLEEARDGLEAQRTAVEAERDQLRNELSLVQIRCRTLEQELEALRGEEGERTASLTQQLESAREETTRLEAEQARLGAIETELTAERDLLRTHLQAFQTQREQLVQTVQQKHQEAVSYHAESVRLAKISEELQTRLTEVEQEAARVLSEKETQWRTEMDRLREHLLSVEDSYTQELLRSQNQEKALRESLHEAEQRASDQFRMGDLLAGWQEKARSWAAEREKLEKEKGELAKSLDRLQHALQQLSRERERDIQLALKDVVAKLAKAESLQGEKDAEMALLRRKLSEAQLGLEAAGRLTQQLDNTAASLASAKEEVLLKEAELARLRTQLEHLQSGTDSKVDKSLVKNLLLGYLTAPSAKHRQEVLRIIATVMEFTLEERQKSGAGSDTPSGLLGGILKMGGGGRSRTSSGSSSVGDAERSLSEAFISFLESESVRPSPPKLSAPVESSSISGAVKPSLTEFQPGRNEPTILRDVLRDTEN